MVYDTWRYHLRWIFGSHSIYFKRKMDGSRGYQARDNSRVSARLPACMAGAFPFLCPRQHHRDHPDGVEIEIDERFGSVCAISDIGDVRIGIDR